MNKKTTVLMIFLVAMSGLALTACEQSPNTPNCVGRYCILQEPHIIDEPPLECPDYCSARQCEQGLCP